MYYNSKLLVSLFVCVSGYKIISDPNTSSDENYSLLLTNQTYDRPANDFASDETEYQRKSSVDEDDVRSEALIKKIHPFVFPKQFNTIDGMPNRGFNATIENMMEIRDNERFDDNFTPPNGDQSHLDGDLVPVSTHLFDRPAKHGNFHSGYFDRPHHQQVLPHANNCMLGLMHGCDPLMLLGILGFLAYVINSVLSLVNRLGLPLLAPTTAAGMTATAATSSLATKASLAQHQLFGIDDQTVESNQKLLKDFERILQMAIEVYEQKINSI